MVRLPLSAALAGCLLAGCAGGTEAFDQRMAGYVGRSETELVGRLGVPTRTYDAPDGSRLLQYDAAPAPAASSGLSLGLGVGSFGWGRGGGVGTGVGLGFGVPVAPAAEGCSATFEVRDGRVAAFRRRGEACPA